MSAAEPRPPSLWLDPPPEPGDALEGDLEVECVVVGAGYTGLWTAFTLADRGVEVAVVERDYAGYGASGRNAGHLTPTIGKDLPTLLRLYGRERAGALVRLAERGVEHVESAIEELGIACEYVPAGNVVAGIHEGHAKTLRRALSAGRELGAALRPLSAAELDERGLPEWIYCGYLEERGGVLDPGRYVRGLREAALARGVKLFEATRVSAVAPGERVRVETARGRLSARTCVLATNAYTPELGFTESVATPLWVSLFATDPLSPAQRELIGWPQGEGIYSAHEVLESYRLTADGRIVGGSRMLRYPRGGKPLPEADPELFARLEAMFRARFPQLGEVAIERCWSGPISITLDFLPVIARARGASNILYSVGCAGHGVAMQSLLGTLLARMAIGEDPGVPELTDRRRIPMPPEPLRGLAARGIIGALEALDRRSDRRARTRGGDQGL